MLQIVPTPSLHLPQEAVIPPTVPPPKVIQANIPVAVPKPSLPIVKPPPPPPPVESSPPATTEKVSPEDLMLQKIAERRAERAKRNEDREKKKSEKEKRKKEKEKKKQLRLKMKTENMIKVCIAVFCPY